MPDDIVTQLRFIVPIHEGRRGHDCIAAAADEIERLRAKNAVLSMKRFSAEVDASDLQALIDAWAEADTDRKILDTSAALLAAATPKEDDRA
jgi:predicted transcriptional regulator